MQAKFATKNKGRINLQWIPMKVEWGCSYSNMQT